MSSDRFTMLLHILVSLVRVYNPQYVLTAVRTTQHIAVGINFFMSAWYDGHMVNNNIH